MNRILIKIWPYLAIIVMGVAIYLLLKQLSNMQDNVDRLAHNMEQSLNDNTQLLYLTKKELKEYYRDSLMTILMDSLNIKYRHIVRTHQEKWTYSYDTTIKMINIDDTTWRFSHKFDSCVSVKGKVDTKDYSITFDDLAVNYTSTSILYWKRPYKFWFINYGKKKYFVQNINNCTGETEIKEIEIVK